jgi:HD-like signal output (HDOD) protein
LKGQRSRSTDALHRERAEKRLQNVRVECAKCHKVYNIPDERLPRDRGISFACQGCGELIKVDLRSGSEPPVDPRSPTKPVQEPTPPGASQDEPPRGEILKKRILRTVKDLPAMPQTVLKAREIMGNPNSSFRDISEILEMDQAIATKVLKLANSAYYGLVGNVSSLQQASVVLGFRTLEELISMAGASGILGSELKGYQMEAGDLWQHSLGVAFGSKIIAGRKNPGIANDAFTAGLIHDVGKLALEPHLYERQEAIVAFMAGGQKSFLEAEKEVLGFDHGEIASELCKGWGIPQGLTAAVRHHHKPSRSNGSELAYMVHTADVITMMSGIGAGIDGMFYRMDDSALEFLGLPEDEMSGIMMEIVESVRNVSEGMVQA